MVIEEKISDSLIRHYSDSGMMIKQVETGIEYSEAIDVQPCAYTYEETGNPIPELSEQLNSTVKDYVDKKIDKAVTSAILLAQGGQ